MARFSGLADVVLFVSDRERAVAFYRDLLGLKVISPPHLPGVFLQVAESEDGVPEQIVLVPRPEGAQAATGGARNLHHVGLRTEPGEYDALRERLAAAGVEMRGGVHPFMELDAFYIDDPEGNEIEIVTRRG